MLPSAFFVVLVNCAALGGVVIEPASSQSTAASNNFNPSGVATGCCVIPEEEEYATGRHDKAIEALVTLLIIIDNRLGRIVRQRGDNVSALRCPLRIRFGGYSP